jgi:hypothetical protein
MEGRAQHMLFRALKAQTTGDDDDPNLITLKKNASYGYGSIRPYPWMPFFRWWTPILEFDSDVQPLVSQLQERTGPKDATANGSENGIRWVV